MKRVAIGRIVSRTVIILRRASHEVAAASPGTGVNAVASSSSLDVQAAETLDLGDGHLAEAPWLEQDAQPVDGDAALHLPPESALVERGLIQG